MTAIMQSFLNSNFSVPVTSRCLREQYLREHDVAVESLTAWSGRRILTSIYYLGQFSFWKHWNKKFFHVLVGVVRIILLDHFQAQSDFYILISLVSFKLSSQASQQLMGGYQVLCLRLLCFQVLLSCFLTAALWIRGSFVIHTFSQWLSVPLRTCVTPELSCTCRWC